MHHEDPPLLDGGWYLLEVVRMQVVWMQEVWMQEVHQTQEGHSPMEKGQEEAAIQSEMMAGWKEESHQGLPP